MRLQRAYHWFHGQRKVTKGLLVCGVVILLICLVFAGWHLLPIIISHIPGFSSSWNWALVILCLAYLLYMGKLIYRRDWSGTLLFFCIGLLEFSIWKLGWIPGAFTWPRIIANVAVVAICLFAIDHLFENHFLVPVAIGSVAILLFVVSVSSDNTTVANNNGSNKTVAGGSVSAECPGGEPKVRVIGAKWEKFNPQHPDVLCDVNYAVLEGSVEVAGPFGKYTPKSGDTGRTSGAPRIVRATTGRATISYVLCPSGHGTKDGHPDCL